MKQFAILAALYLTATLAAQGQTTQSITAVGPVDFSGATSTKPFKSGTAVPGSCTATEWFFKSDTGDLYKCSAGTFTLHSSGGGGGLTDGCTVTTTSTTITVASGCTFRVGSVIYTLSSPAVWTVSGTPTVTAYVFGGPDGTTSQVSIGTVGGVGSCDADCVALTLSSGGFPAGVYPIATVPITAGAVGTAVDRRAVGFSQRTIGGTGITVSVDSAGNQIIDNTGLPVSTSMLTDLFPVRQSNTLMVFGASCSSSAPCRINWGTKPNTVTSPVSTTLSGTSASGTVYLWNGESGIIAGHNTAATITCSGCTPQTGVTGFPIGFGTPIAAVTFTNNVWDTVTAAMDRRVMMGMQAVRPGSSGTLTVTYNANGWTDLDLAGTRYIPWDLPLVSGDNNAGSGRAASGWWFPNGVPYGSPGDIPGVVRFPRASPITAVIDKRIPLEWNGGQVSVAITATSSDNYISTTKTWAFKISTKCWDDRTAARDVTETSKAYNTGGVDTVTIAVLSGQTSRVLVINSGASANQFALTGCSPGYLMRLKLERDTTNGSDDTSTGTDQYAAVKTVEIKWPTTF